MISHGDAHAAMLPSFEVVLELSLAMNSLWINIRDREMGSPWDRVSGLCVNDSQILLTAGADTTTMMASFLL